MDKLKFALIGAGTWGNAHAEIYSSHHLSEMVAVCDVSNERAAQVAKKYSVESLLIGKVIIILMRKQVEINKNRLFFLIFCDYNSPSSQSNKEYNNLILFYKENRRPEIIRLDNP